MPSVSDSSNPNIKFTVNITDTGEDYVEFEASWVSTSHSFNYERYVKFQITGFGTSVIESNEIGGANSTFDGYIDGLEPNTIYKWKATLGWGDANGGSTYSTWAVVSGEFKTDSDINIEIWDWEISNGNATAEETWSAHEMLYGRADINSFSYKVWNDFVDKVMEMRTYVGDGTWDTVSGTYLSYKDCHVKAGETLSAHKYNSVKIQIGQYASGGTWANVSAGDTISRTHIIGLADKLNGIIESL
jgi:hypothetical protein